jgi:hypothetical protein
MIEFFLHAHFIVQAAIVIALALALPTLGSLAFAVGAAIFTMLVAGVGVILAGIAAVCDHFSVAERVRRRGGR